MIRRTRFGTAALAAFLLLGSGPASSDDEAAALLARHRTYAGWQLGDGTVATLRDGRKTFEEPPAGAGRVLLATAAEARIGALFRDIETIGGTTVETGFTGNLF